MGPQRGHPFRTSGPVVDFRLPMLGPDLLGSQEDRCIAERYKEAPIMGRKGGLDSKWVISYDGSNVEGAETPQSGQGA